MAPGANLFDSTDPSTTLASNPKNERGGRLVAFRRFNLHDVISAARLARGLLYSLPSP